MGFCGFSDMLIQRCVQPRQAQTRKVLLFSWESFQSRRERLGKRKLGNFQSWFARYQNRRSMGVGRQGKFVLIFSCLSGLDNLFICARSAAQACANIAGPLRKRSASWQSHFFWEKESLDFLSEVPISQKTSMRPAFLWSGYKFGLDAVKLAAKLMILGSGAAVRKARYIRIELIPPL